MNGAVVMFSAVLFGLAGGSHGAETSADGGARKREREMADLLKPATSFSREQLRLPGKKGVCLTLHQPGDKKGGRGSWETNLPRLKALRPAWNYSWGARRIEQQPEDVEFVPMVWGAWDRQKLEACLRSQVAPQLQAGRARLLLGFNEPDKPDQADMPVAAAIEFWPALEQLGIPLCSPACANTEGIHDDSAQGVRGTWMRDFMREADRLGLRVDYIGVHSYGGASAEGFKARMKRIHEKYGRRPLLITEFAVADWKAASPSANRHTPAQVLAFMKQVLPWMEEQEWIAGYAWFSFNIDSPAGTSSALFDQAGGLTACGRYYQSVTPDNPRGDQGIAPDPNM